MTGQQVSMIVNILCFVFVVGNLLVLIRLQIFNQMLMLLLLIPLAAYSINYQGQDFSDLSAWFKRAIFGVVNFGACILLFYRVSGRTLVIFSELTLLITCGLVVYSWINPLESLYLFTGGADEQWGDVLVFNVNSVGGSFVNPNSAGVALVGLYLTYHVFLKKIEIVLDPFHILFIDILLIGCILVGGSRSSFIIGASCVLANALFRRFQMMTPKEGAALAITPWSIRDVLLICFILAAGAAFLSSLYDSIGAIRIFNLFKGEEDGSALDSTEARIVALQAALEIFTVNPFFGIGFDSRELKGAMLPHNTLAYYAVTNGIFALAFILIFVYSLLSRVVKVGLPSMSICYIVFLVGNIFTSHTFFEEKPFPWIIAGIMYFVMRTKNVTASPKDHLQNPANR